MGKLNTKTIVATGLGTALFMVLFMFVKIPSPIPETNLQIAYGISGFFAAVFGPVCGLLVAFVGHALSDFISYGSPWWSWVVASGVCAMITGFAYKKVSASVEDGVFGKKEMGVYALWSIIGNAVAWGLTAPVLDIVMYAEPANKVFVQGGVAFVLDAVCTVAIGIILLAAYAKSKIGKGTLSKEEN
ncbi:MAG: ECF-type riboflavin transporter substrate-binding protein [Erysipelotrichia bacterium]|nr:ECF-type riboflavin transporter substrate-binding protein [Erysipelotrichia bacterium]